MTIVFISNYLSPHQKPFCDAVYKLTKGHFKFIATTAMTSWRKDSGFEEIQTPYLIDISSGYNRDEAQRFIDEADAVITDAVDLKLTQKRYNEGRLTFRCSERLFKSRLRYLKAPIHWWKAWQTRRMYFLCSSAYTSRDFAVMGFFRGRSFKWGYFPATQVYDSELDLMKKKVREVEAPRSVSILWVARPIRWKHPELAIKLAERLKTKGKLFSMKMIGKGKLDEWCHQLIQEKHLEDCVDLMGAMPMERVREEMERSQIFIFTSDRNEGWGAVMNESMNSGCAVVANKAIGSVPYLIENGLNGLTYSTEQEFFEKVEWLIDNPKELEQMGRSAYETIINTWNAETAANNLIKLVDDLLHGREISIKHGPCSKA